MTLRLLNPRSAGAFNDWGIAGAASAWEALTKGSPTSSFIASGTALQQTTCFCGDGRAPICGFIASLIVRFKVRRSVISTGGSINLLVDQNGILQTAGNFVPADTITDWQDAFVRVREDWTTGARFTGTELVSLSVGVELAAIPSVGSFNVSELYLEVEQVDTIDWYDPYSGSTPDAVVGPRALFPLGGQPAVLTVDNYLEITDTSTADALDYLQFLPVLTYRQEYITQIETVVKVTSLPVSPTGAAYILGFVGDESAILLFVLCVVGNVQMVGVLEASALLSFDDPNLYAGLAPLTFLNIERHFRLVVDRNLVAEDRGLIQVFVDHSSTPVIEVFYDSILPPIPPVGSAFMFGTNTTQECTVLIDYVSWGVSKRNGYKSNEWIEFDQGTNDVERDPTDPEISKLITIPPGVIAGQSDVACKLIYPDDLNSCGIYTIYDNQFGGAATFALDVAYRSEGYAADFTEVICQRCSDLYYWDEAGSVWSAIFKSVTLPLAATRTVLSVFTNLVNAQPEGLIFTIQNFDPGGVPGLPPTTWIYKVYLSK